MALTDPALFSLQNAAMIPRGVYCSGLGKAFAIWTVIADNGCARFVARQHDGADGSDFDLGITPQIVTAFDCFQTSTANRVVVFFSNYTGLRYFVYDFATLTIIVNVTEMTEGGAPSVTFGTSNNLYLYEFRRYLRARVGLSGYDARIFSTASHVVKEIDTTLKSTAKFRYLGAHGTNVDVALPLRADANTVFLFDLRDDIT